MNIKNVQVKRASKTAIYPNRGDNITYPALGLCGESGEVAEHVKKIIRDDNGQLTKERRHAMIFELGDILWYLSQIAFELDTTLEAIANYNLAKLASRAERDKLQGSGDNR